MGFKALEAVAQRNASGGCRAALVAPGRAKYVTLQITLAADIRKEMGLGDGDEGFVVLIGEDDDHGLIRIRRAKPGDGHVVTGVAVRAGRGARGGVFHRLRLGHVPLFRNAPAKGESCIWEKLDDGWFEIVLPSWADETAPKRGAVTAVDPVVVKAERAGEADRAAQERERREAEERRAAREQAEAASEERAALRVDGARMFHRSFKLTATEAALLRILVENRGKLVGREKIFDALYALKPGGDVPEPKIVDVYICKLRAKLKNVPHVICRIDTQHGQGFTLKGSIAGLYDDESEAA